MFKGMLALGLAGALLGCGGGGGFDEILKKGKAFKDRTCACKDQACLDGVQKEMEAWFEKAAKNFKGEPSKAQEAAWDKMEAEAEACQAKVKEADGAVKGAAALAMMTELKNKMCACTDQACADKVGEELMASAKSMNDVKGTEAQTKEATAIAEELAKCMTKATTPADPPPGPGDLATPPSDPAAPSAPAAPPGG